MHVAKWGNSLAIRLPQALVAELNLQPGDEVEIVAATRSRLVLIRDRRRQDALDRMENRRWPGTDTPFDREEANER